MWPLYFLCLLACYKKLIRLLFLFLWGSKIEKAKREILFKKKKYGGFDFPNLEVFIGVNYVCFFMESYFKDTKMSHMQRFLAGTMIRRSKWANSGISKPVSFWRPEWHLYIETFLQKFYLDQIEKEQFMKEKGKVKMMCKDRMMCMINGLSSDEAKME